MEKICGYNNFDYQSEFWYQNREYEDLSERLALRNLLPESGHRLVDLGCGFGRLAKEYLPHFENITLFDYSEKQISQAKEKINQLLGNNKVDYPRNKIKFFIGDIYNLPFSPESFDLCLMVRVIHHLENPPAALNQIRRILPVGGIFILEYANKRNFLEIMRFLLRRPNISPFDYHPSSRGELYDNFHPKYIRDLLARFGFEIKKTLSVSNFRHPLIKKTVKKEWLKNADSFLQYPLGLIKFGPSIFIKAEKVR